MEIYTLTKKEGEPVILPPEGGWEPSSYYVVDVQFSKHNPVHRAVFYTGFLHDGVPGGYNTLFNPTYDQYFRISDAHYMKAIRKLNVDQ